MRTGRAVPLAAVTLLVLLLVAGTPAAGARTGAGTPTPSTHPAAESPQRAPAVFSPGTAMVGGGQGRVLVSTGDRNAVPNDGLEVNLTAFTFQNLPSDSSFQVGAEEGIGAFTAVFGVFQNTRTAPTAFFSVFTNLTDVNVRVGYWTTFPLVPLDSYLFALTHDNGTNWSLHVNGYLFGGNASAGTFDFGAVTATWLASIGFSEVAIYSSQSTTPPLVDAPLAFAVRETSGWYLPVTAQASYVGSGGAQWGVEGRAQRPTLAPGELETGSTIGNLTNGTVVWTGGPVAVHVALAFTAPSAVATAPEETYATVTTLGGAPIPGAPVYLSDRLNGSFNPPTAVSNATGVAQSLFETPNVSSPRPDLVTAIVTLFGYLGSSGIALALTPPSQVFLSADPSHPRVAPNGQITVTFTATDVNGTGIAGVFLSFTASASAAVDPGSGATDGSGRFSVTLLAPSAPASVELFASVAGVGQWGHRLVLVDVRPPPGPFWVQYAGPIEWGVAVGVIAAVVVLLLERRRRQRRALPAMPLRRIIREMNAVPGASTPPGTGPGDPTRTRP